MGKFGNFRCGTVRNVIPFSCGLSFLHLCGLEPWPQCKEIIEFTLALTLFHYTSLSPMPNGLRFCLAWFCSSMICFGSFDPIENALRCRFSVFVHVHWSQAILLQFLHFRHCQRFRCRLFASRQRTMRRALV